MCRMPDTAPSAAASANSGIERRLLARVDGRSPMVESARPSARMLFDLVLCTALLVMIFITRALVCNQSVTILHLSTLESRVVE